MGGGGFCLVQLQKKRGILYLFLFCDLHHRGAEPISVKRLRSLVIDSARLGIDSWAS